MNALPPATGLLPLASIFMFHFGSKHLVFDLTPGQKLLFRHPIMQTFVLASMFFVSTRNIQLTLVLVIVYLLAIHILLNESHPYSILKHLVDVTRDPNTEPPSTSSARPSAPGSASPSYK